MDEFVTRYVIKTRQGYVTCYRRGRMTKHLESARTFKTYRGAKMNRFAASGTIFPVEMKIMIAYVI